MKTFIKLLLGILVMTILGYAPLAFILWSANPADWTGGARFISVACALIGLIVYLASLQVQNLDMTDDEAHESVSTKGWGGI